MLERRRRILLLARPFKDVAASEFLAAQIAGFPLMPIICSLSSSVVRDRRK